MSDAGQPGKTRADFESVLVKADAKVATFEKIEHTPLQRVRGLLHSYPTAIPVIVLLLSIAQ